jgi:hypothetical protein
MDHFPRKANALPDLDKTNASSERLWMDNAACEGWVELEQEWKGLASFVEEKRFGERQAT